MRPKGLDAARNHGSRNIRVRSWPVGASRRHPTVVDLEHRLLSDLLKFARRPATKVGSVHGWQVIRNNRLSELRANEHVPLRCDSILWLALPLVLACVGRYANNCAVLYSELWIWTSEKG